MKNRVVYVVLLFLFAACATVPLTGRKQLSLLPESQMAALGYDNYKQILAQSKLSDDPGEAALLQSVGKKIAASAEAFLRENGREKEIKDYAWEFNLIEDDKTVNAFCLPGGKVAAYTGILPVTRDENGLAVVIGHEIAHAIARHGNERMSQMLLVQLGGLTLAQAAREKPQRTQELLQLAYGAGTSIGVLLPYSRDHETEADHIGLVLMARAGYDPDAAVPFWQRMSKDAGARPPEFLSTHPAPERRIDNIKRFIPEARKYYSAP